MHIDHSNLTMETEADVEQKLIMPLLTNELFLGISSECIYTKEYLAPTKLDKLAGRTTGYYPDYTVWMRGFAVLLVEAKSPEVDTEVGYREASLYARHLNQSYITGLNPSQYIISTNGKKILCGHWDANPVLEMPVADLRIGTASYNAIREFCSSLILDKHALLCLQKIKKKYATRPFNIAGGQALLNAKKPLNTFAADLSPILRRYFSSANQENNREIAARAYVSSAEVTEYDRVLEALLKDRLVIRRDVLVRRLEPTRHSEQNIARAISEFRQDRPEQGQLQIIQGAVGAGKSLFIRRYKEVLQPTNQAEHTRWAFVDFNTAPPDLSDAQIWLCSSFIESFQQENPLLDITSNETLRGIFSRNLQRRKGIYEEISLNSPEQAAVTRALDLAKWQDDHLELAKGLADYVIGNRREALVIVMDNVDRLDLKNQLYAFQLTLWFMERTRSFVILQMRDETYERFKNKPPLDTFRSGITFHISPPRFIDVIKKRLELSLEYLTEHSDESHVYTLETGARIRFPSSELGRFLRDLYIELFERRKNISRVLEAIAGRDVRRALEMFVSIITSGHLSETAITSNVRGAGAVPITEANVLKILMRTDYNFASDQSGFTVNIFNFDAGWQKPDNFIIIEVLFFLARNRKQPGQIGLEGYFTCRYITEELQRRGYVKEDVLAALNVLLKYHLITADHMNFINVGLDDSVRILASGFIHIRVLSERLEYLYGIIPTTPILDQTIANQLAKYVKKEADVGNLDVYVRVEAVEVLGEYLFQQMTARDKVSLVEEQESGAAYVIDRMRDAIRVNAGSNHSSTTGNLLDL